MRSSSSGQRSGWSAQGLGQGERERVADDHEDGGPLSIRQVPQADGIEVRRGVHQHGAPVEEGGEGVQWAVPWVKGDAGRQAGALGEGPLGDLGRCRDGVAAQVAARERREQQVLVAPDDALGPARRAAGVEDVAIVAAAPGHDRTIGCGLGQCRLVVGTPFDQRRVGGDGRSDLVAPVGLVDDDLRGGVEEQVAELVGGVAGVDVDRDGAQLECGEHALEVLVAVAQSERDVVTGTDASRRQGVGESVGPFVELGVGPAGIVGHDGLPVSGRVHHALEEVTEVPAQHRRRR